MKYHCYAACLFGMEKPVALELEHLGIPVEQVRDGRVFFMADAQQIALANLHLRCADRVYLVLGEFEATSFEELFEGVQAIDFTEFIGKHTAFPVLGDCVQSTLMSVSHVQSICKKAVVNSLQKRYRIEHFDEQGDKVQLYVNILRDKVTLCLNTSGPGLNRRGYRVFNAKAPMRETLAAGLIFLSRWRDREFYDIMCGSGTIAIEAAMKRKNMAPGSLRGFDAEKWGSQWNRAFAQARQAAKDQLLNPPAGCIHAYDIDPKCVEMTRLHAKKAGVAELMDIRQADAAQFDGGKENATILSNPPYGMRLMEKEQIAQLMGQVGRNLQKREDLRYYFISGDPQFERAFGKKCDKKRKLYNGNLLCYFYQYFR